MGDQVTKWQWNIDIKSDIIYITEFETTGQER